MSLKVITARATDSVFAAAKKMSEHSVSCVVILEGEEVIGILTEKDILEGVAQTDVDFHRLTVTERMSSPVEVMAPGTPVVDAGMFMESRGIKRLPIMDAGQLLGIVTQTDITRGLVSLSPLRYVSDIMTTEVAAVEAQALIAEAARIMTAEGISCVIAMHRNEPAGILTEKDVLKRVVALHKDPTQTQVADVMSFPIMAITPDYSVLSASKRMDKMHVHRLVVMEGKTVRGIITQTDIMRAVRHELEKLEQEHRALTAQLASQVKTTIDNLEQLYQFLSGLATGFDPQSAAAGGTPGSEVAGPSAEKASAPVGVDIGGIE